MLWFSIRKYGRENFKKEILEFFDTRSELRDREKDYVNETFIEDPMCMNLRIGGEGGASLAGNLALKEKLKTDPTFLAKYQQYGRNTLKKLKAAGIYQICSLIQVMIFVCFSCHVSVFR